VAPGGEGLGWAVGVGGSEAEVGEDLFDDRGLVNEGDDLKGAAALRAEQRIGLMNGRKVGVVTRWSSPKTGHRIQQPRPLQELLQNLRVPHYSLFAGAPCVDNGNHRLPCF